MAVLERSLLILSTRHYLEPEKFQRDNVLQPEEDKGNNIVYSTRASVK